MQRTCNPNIILISRWAHGGVGGGGWLLITGEAFGVDFTIFIPCVAFVADTTTTYRYGPRKSSVHCCFSCIILVS